MTLWPEQDELDRTAKILLDEGQANSPAEAVAILELLKLQVAVGPLINASGAGQAALATIVNAGSRAFRGGVLVQIDDDPLLTEGWGTGMRLSEMVSFFGGRVVTDLRPDLPTLVVGDPDVTPVGNIVLWTTWSGWIGAVVENKRDRLAGSGLILSGVVAGSLGVAETFQFTRKSSLVAGRREVGISLWTPHVHWRNAAGIGPDLAWLPSRLWLLGLGHLGQGNAWSLGWLPFAIPSDVRVHLMDTDVAVKGNRATGLLLLEDHDLNRHKTRVIADRLERLGLTTAIVERRFDENLWPNGDEPSLALAGFDAPGPRRLLGGARDGFPRFDRVIDAGLGHGPEYMNVLIQTFPSQRDPATAFPSRIRTERPMSSAYLAEIERRVLNGEDRGDVTCGITDIAGITVGAAYVGATVGALVVADALRYLHSDFDAANLAVLALDLRSPDYVDAAVNTSPGTFVNTGATSVR